MKPQDVKGECNAHLYIYDDHSDNCATMRCHLESGHDGPHEEVYSQDGSGTPVTVTWHKDQREDR